MATIKEERIQNLPSWQLHGDGISRTFHFEDFGAATRFVDRITLDAAVAACQPAIDIRGDRVTVTLATRDATTPTSDDVAVARRIQRLVGDHRHPVGRAGPWSPEARSPASAHAQWGRPARKAQLRHLPAWRQARDPHAAPHPTHPMHS
jgi:4a-hydroxytetrahydrobiopterin dehydratase